MATNHDLPPIDLPDMWILRGDEITNPNGKFLHEVKRYDADALQDSFVRGMPDLCLLKTVLDATAPQPVTSDLMSEHSRTLNDMHTGFTRMKERLGIDPEAHGAARTLTRQTIDSHNTVLEDDLRRTNRELRLAHAAGRSIFLRYRVNHHSPQLLARVRGFRPSKPTVGPEGRQYPLVVVTGRSDKLRFAPLNLRPEAAVYESVKV